MEFYRPNTLLKHFVLVNGTARCGKSLIAPIISSFKNVEIERMEGIFDYLSIAYYFGKIDRDCAINLVRTIADEYIYASYLSRNTNFRWSDHSSVFKSSSKLKYFYRLFSKEGQRNVERILRERPVYQNQSHDQMRFVKLFFEAWGETFRMIEIIRHPIEQIDTWIRRDWGTRYCADPMAVTPCIKHGDSAVPFYAHGWEEEYLQISPIDRIIKMLHGLQFLNYKAYQALTEKEKSQILLIKFEDFVEDPFTYTTRLSSFLGVETSHNTKSSILKQGCPRTVSIQNRKEILENIRKQASYAYSKLITEMINNYESEL